MEYALTTKDQGTGAFIATPSLSNTAVTPWIMGGVFIVHDLAANQQLLGDSGSNQKALRVYTDGSLAVRSSALDRIRSPAGMIVPEVPFAWEVRNNITTGNWELYLGDLSTPVGTFARGSTSWLLNQIGRFFNTTTTATTVLSFYASGGTYNDAWNGSTTTGAGTSWTSTSGTRALTITGATGAADSWWIPQGATLVPVTSFRILETAFRAEVSSSVQATTSFRQSLEKLETLATSLRANVSGLFTLETAFGASLSSVQRSAALQVVLRSQVSRTSQANAVFRTNVSKASTFSTALRASLEVQTALQAQLLGIASAYKVLSVNLEGTTDWTAPAFRVAMSLETPRASLSFGNKAGISFSTPRAKI